MVRRNRIFSHQSGDLDRFSFWDFKGLAWEPARRILRDALEISSLSLFSHSCKHNAITMDDLARDAQLAGAISDDDQAELTFADVTYEGTKNGEPVFVLAEISITVEVDDVERAAHRASILQQATGVPTFAGVIGTGIEADAATAAENKSVAYAQVSEE